jgi:Spy/CpxP family protein refolding chaperone
MRACTRISIAMLLTLFLAVTMSAQTAEQSAPPAAKRGPHAGERGFDRMAQQLNLTDQQKTQIQGLFQTQRQQAHSIRQDTSLSPQQKQDKLKQLRESTHQQMQSVLTPEQQQKFQQLRSEHEGMGKDHMGRGGMGPGGGMGPLAHLNLTPEQKSKIQPIMQSSRQQIQAVRADSSLTPEQKQAKVREIHQNAMSQVNAVLTPEQQQQLQQMRKGRSGKRGGSPAPPGGL